MSCQEQNCRNGGGPHQLRLIRCNSVPSRAVSTVMSEDRMNDRTLLKGLLAGALWVVASGAWAESPPNPAQVEAEMPRTPAAIAGAKELAREPAKPPPPAKTIAPDPSGRKESGKASLYGPEFNGRTMANGQRFEPQSNAAASKSLPLGTVAKVTNLDNGRTAKVEVKDRGPFVKSRVVDVTPSTAKKLGLEKKGVAPVVVAPIAVPQPDGSVKAGTGAADIKPVPAEEAKK
jgi:rare lipoprotein A